MDRAHRGLDDGGPAARVEDLARDHGRDAAEQAMTRADQVVESAADRLEAIVRNAQQSGGVKAKAGSALAEDPSFLRKLKPSLVAARVRGENPPAPGAPSGSRLDGPVSTLQKQPKKSGGSMSPWLVVGAALAAGYVLAKVIDWRGHAHPRR